MLRGVGIAYAKAQSVQRSDCASGTEMGRACYRDTRELPAGLVLLALQELGLYMKSRFILDTASARCYLFSLSFPITQGSQFPVLTSFQKLKVGRCRAGICSQLSLCPYPDLTSRPGKLAGTSWWGRGRGNTICCSLLSVSPLSGPHPLL